MIMFLLFVSSAFCVAEDLDIDSYKEAIDKARNSTQDITVPENIHKEKADAEAKRAFDYYNSDVFRSRLDSEISRIKTYFDTGMFPDPDIKSSNPSVTHYYKAPLSGSSLLGSDERVYVLVSTSVPMSTLKNYLLSIEKAKDPGIRMIFRGLPKDNTSRKPILVMKDFLLRLLARNEDCTMRDRDCRIRASVQVDPVVFRRHSITDNVPAIVYARGVRVNDPGLSEGMEHNAAVNEFYVVRGDVALEYALELFRREMAGQGKATAGLDKLISSLNNSFFKGE